MDEVNKMLDASPKSADPKQEVPLKPAPVVIP